MSVMLQRGFGVDMGNVPGDYVEQAKHAAPSACAGLAKVWEVLEVIRGDVTVDGEFAVTC